MTYKVTSRYYRADQRKVSTSRGDQQVVYMTEMPKVGTRGLGVVHLGSTPDSVAWRLYSDPTQWWKVVAANPQIVFPSDMKPGSLVWVPR